jgi:recombinational DNA repair ATPase RecF
MTHPDAAGYLSDLARETNTAWFNMVSDMAIEGATSLSERAKETLFSIFAKKASYLAPRLAPGAVTAAGQQSPADFLESLDNFSNFKLIGDVLSLRFQKRITLIFGTNGSGKSSLCEALKLLSSTHVPTRPLQNVHSTLKTNPTFQYKLRSDPAAILWTQTTGYGVRSSTVKYFDTNVANSNVKIAVEPGRVIELAPFKLHLFSNTSALTNQFRVFLQQRDADNSVQLGRSLYGLRAAFTKFANRPLATIAEASTAILDEAISMGEAFDSANDLAAKRAAAIELEKATSEEGIKLLRSERRELKSLLDSFSALTAAVSGLTQLDLEHVHTMIAAKQEAQRILAAALLPKGSSLEAVKALAKAAKQLCNMDNADGESCPLCRRELGISEVQLFAQYNNLLAGELERDITTLKAEIIKAESFLEAIGAIKMDDWKTDPSASAEILAEAIRLGETLSRGCTLQKGVSQLVSAALNEAEKLIATLTQLHTDKSNAIDIATRGQAQLLTTRAALLAEIEPLAYAEALQGSLDILRDASIATKRAAFFARQLPAFQGLLTKITNSAKRAHEDLVVTDFEARLNREYQSLTERDMAAFGVKLLRKGTDSSVTVLPQVGGKDLAGVLSEGEQRVHALALFFAELESCKQSVIVFDDPVSSFDYNFIGNFCWRLRDFAQAHPSRQIIVLTHNWEFFVHLQTAINQQHNLQNALSVQVLENCSTVAEYSEDVARHKIEIDSVLAQAGEPSKAQKELMAGNLRILIEAIVNTHVFAKQRHQYKQKSQPISNFNDYTKLVPLLPAEATELRNLYAKLSTTEHDDPRNAYINTDKAMFNARYTNIVAIESAIIARK